MIIYIDVYFLINLIIDFIILSMSLSGLKTHIVRRILGAFLGAVYACMYFFDVPEILFSTPSKLTVLFLMTFTAVFPCRIKTLLKSYVLVFFTSVFICGTIYAVMSFFYTSPLTNLVKISDLVVVTGTLIGYISFTLYMKVFKKQLSVSSHHIKIFYKGKSIKVHGITDTGNSLTDPISGNPVIVADERILKKLIDSEVCSENLCEFVSPEDFRVIPFKTVSASGIMYGFVPEKIEIDNYSSAKVIVAAAPKSLETDVLINPLLIGN